MEFVLDRQDKTPLYLQISGQIRQRIADGTWAPGNRIPSYRELTEQLGVSSTTVIQAVDDLIRDGLIVRLRGSGTYVAESVNHALGMRRTAGAQNGTAASTLNIGIFALQPENDHWTNFFHEPLRLAVYEAVGNAGAQAIPEPASRELLDIARRRKIDGLVIGQFAMEDRRYVDELSKARIPYVIIGGPFADRALPCVSADNAGGTTLAVQHLKDLGHRKIGFVNLNLSNPDHQIRWESFQQATAMAGITVDPRLLLLNANLSQELLKFEAMKPVIRDWVDRGLPPVTALIACSLLEGVATLQVLLERGYRVPEDISLVTYDDSPAAILQTPSLTTIRQPIVELGRRLVERLIAAIHAGQMPEGPEILPMQLIARKSTQALAS